MRRRVTVMVLMLLTIGGCIGIPKNGSVLSRSVSEGIARNQIETEKIIKALVNVERAILDQEWDTIYAKVEQKYRNQHHLSDSNALTQAQRRAIAANAAAAYFALRDRIAAIENTLISQTRSNSKTLIEMNDDMTMYLLSVENLEATRENIAKRLGDLVSIDLSSIAGIARALIGGI